MNSYRFGKMALLSAAVMMAAVSQVQAAALTLSAQNTDREINSDNTLGADGGTERAGFSAFNSVYGRNAMFVFQLPTLGAGETIVSAELQLTVVTVTGTPTFNGDLYGVGFGASSTPPSAFYSGANDSSATIIADNLIPQGTAANATVTTSGKALADYLKSLYQSGAKGGDYVYLRVSPDSDLLAQSVGYNIGAAGARGTGNGATSPPVMTVQTATVPEAASLGLLSVCAGVLFLRRR